ncbi:hypothetical protein LshimejAT787_0502890 [Lyophyllum shimeji]|uniref:Uncharacterized protein n=1 Tax=Lyophyllum shimeji TaxID=47721 RepID=A0A9P3UKR8_LYOSH|nr:hypothetical protein LshimejAT787_0502890 [Lyophyllum shimeji]
MSSPHRPHRPALLSSQTSYPAELAPPRPRHRERTVSLISLPSGKSRILLDFPKAEPAVVTPHILPSHSAYVEYALFPGSPAATSHA